MQVQLLLSAQENVTLHRVAFFLHKCFDIHMAETADAHG